MSLHPLSIWSGIIAVLSLVGVVVLTALHDKVPAELPFAMFTMLGVSGSSGILNPPKQGQAATVLADDTAWLATSTVLTALITTGGAVAVAVISKRQTRTEGKLDKVHEQLKTSNGKSVGDYVEAIATETVPKATIDNIPNVEDKHT